MTYKNSFHKPKYQDSKPVGMYAGINGAKRELMNWVNTNYFSQMLKFEVRIKKVQRYLHN